MKNFALLFTLLLILIGLNTANAQAVADPAALPVYSTTVPLTIDGQLLEPAWAYNTPHLMFNQNGTPSGNSNTPTNGAVIRGDYRDISTLYMKFLRSGMNLYISLNSNDQQVCSFGDSWEGDGLFMKIKNAANVDVEYKLYYNLHTVDPGINYEGPAHSSGAGYKKPGTIVNDSTNVDAGYTAELLISLTGLGFTTAPASVQVMFVIFEPDHYNASQGAWGTGGNFYKQWWGSEWGPDMRTLNLLTDAVPVELTSFTAVTDPKGITLNWATATETNNKGFEIQRSSDNANFVTLGFVTGKGSTADAQEYSYIDNIAINGNYYYRLKQIDYNGNFTYSDVIEVVFNVPTAFALAQNYPNPFNPSTTINFGLPVKSEVTVEVYNLVGELVSTIANGSFEAGSHQVNFNAANLTSGVYIYTVRANGIDGQNFISSNKMTLLK